jgi:hypothetical protein
MDPDVDGIKMKTTNDKRIGGKVAVMTDVYEWVITVGEYIHETNSNNNNSVNNIKVSAIKR